MSIRQLDVWVLTAEWYDDDNLHHGHAFFYTKRDAEAVGKALKDDADDFTFVVEKAQPWGSSTRTAVPPATINTMIATTKKEWDL